MNVPFTMNLTEAWARGFAAGRALLSPGNCPFEPDTREYLQWMKGFVEGLGTRPAGHAPAAAAAGRSLPAFQP